MINTRHKALCSNNETSIDPSKQIKEASNPLNEISNSFIKNPSIQDVGSKIDTDMNLLESILEQTESKLESFSASFKVISKLYKLASERAYEYEKSLKEVQKLCLGQTANKSLATKVSDTLFDTLRKGIEIKIKEKKIKSRFKAYQEKTKNKPNQNNQILAPIKTNQQIAQENNEDIGQVLGSEGNDLDESQTPAVANKDYNQMSFVQGTPNIQNKLGSAANLMRKRFSVADAGVEFRAIKAINKPDSKFLRGFRMEVIPLVRGDIRKSSKAGESSQMASSRSQMPSPLGVSHLNQKSTIEEKNKPKDSKADISGICASANVLQKCPVISESSDNSEESSKEKTIIKGMVPSINQDMDINYSDDNQQNNKLAFVDDTPDESHQSRTLRTCKNKPIVKKPHLPSKVVQLKTAVKSSISEEPDSDCLPENKPTISSQANQAKFTTLIANLFKRNKKKQIHVSKFDPQPAKAENKGLSLRPRSNRPLKLKPLKQSRLKQTDSATNEPQRMGDSINNTKTYTNSRYSGKNFSQDETLR